MGLSEQEKIALDLLRVAMRRLRFHGSFDGFNHPWEGESMERAIAHAQYCLGILDEGLNKRLYGFGAGTED